MAAPTNTYCDYATGNDYKGATFTDGAFTVGDMTLTKAGAFAASKANHWLYLDDNGSGEVTPGYYKIASVTSANAVVLATSPKSGANDPTDVVCTQHDGSTSLPWRSIQGALDLITRDATNGDQINVCSSTAQVNQASLNPATYGTPAENIPLIIRGYTTTANDGGIAEINANGASFYASGAGYSHTILVDLQIHSFGNNNGVVMAAHTYMYHCEVHKGASTPGGKILVSGNANAHVVGCYIHDAGTTGSGIYSAKCLYNYLYLCPNLGLYSVTLAIGNIVHNCGTGIYVDADNAVVVSNTIYNSLASTGSGISVATNATYHVILNNVIEGYSGVGAEGILSVPDIAILGFNAFFNNTTNESLADVYVDLGNDATLASSPFTDAASGDFSLNTAVAGAIDGAFPGAWYGPAGTTDHADIGAVQMPAGAGGGGMLQANKRGNKQ